MVELVSGDRPAVLCLQEVPPWSLDALAGWSGMRSHSIVARPPRRPAALASWVTRLDQGLFRSRLAGQAQAILVDRALESESLGGTQVSDAGRERRVVHAVRIGGVGVVGNIHATNAPTRPELVEAELARAALFLESVAGRGEPRILAGDFNTFHPLLPLYENGGPGIDNVLVSGLQVSRLTVWPLEQRVQNGVVLSDHAPVERVVG